MGLIASYPAGAQVTSDPLTADAAAIPRPRGRSELTLQDCARAFIRQRSPWLIGAGLVTAVAARLALGHWSWRDAVIPVGLVAFEPFTEWVIHIYLLHSRPLAVAGREFELPTAREHRAHHLAPADLDGVLIPAYGVLIFLPMIASVIWGLSFPLQLVLGGDRVAWAASGLIAAYAILATYEWCHFLIHTPYRPRGRYYRSIWRSHRLHHYKSEHYWFGITSNLGDRALGTAPDQRGVTRSATARTLERSGA